ncbi:hypothetical protein NI17_011335 [Thermobifida halotolerans]|uniref:Uncharacterized protein n=1 Tax=Thermobifida halotolerans TaxID=483545 RepID=A0A399G9V5_9ACTN|nr:hypothetical protein [Thermobifida halotolerans]UOE21632.1 hypothetical protein NI17_011335 [Thermobifida halotolerans]
MPFPADRWLTVPSTIAVLAATGCSGIADQVAESIENAARGEITEFEDLSVLCGDIGGGFPEAAARSGSGPRPTVLFFDSIAADSDTTTGYELAAPREDLAPDATPIVGWHPDSLDQTELLVCAEGHGAKEELHTCDYADDWGSGSSTLAVPMFSQEFSFTVYELATGRVVHETEMLATNGSFIGSGLTTDCPSFLQYDPQPTELYAQPNADDIHALLAETVEGKAA